MTLFNIMKMKNIQYTFKNSTLEFLLVITNNKPSVVVKNIPYNPNIIKERIDNSNAPITNILRIIFFSNNAIKHTVLDTIMKNDAIW